MALDQHGLMVASSNSSNNKATRRSTLSSKEASASVEWERTLRRVRFGDMVVVNLKARHQGD